MFAALLCAHAGRLEAAELLGRTFDYGVFVNDRRFQVSRAPVAITGGQTVRIQGWILDTRTMKPGASLLCAVDGGAAAPVSGYPLPRPDVALRLHDPEAARSGFELPVNIGGLRTGLHRFHFTLIGSDGSVTVIPTDVELSIANK